MENAEVAEEESETSSEAEPGLEQELCEKMLPNSEQYDEEVEWTAEDDETWDAETDRDYYAALELGKTPSVSSSRVRAAYHKQVQRWHPYNGTWHLEGDTADDPMAHGGRRAALRRFWAISEAYLVLADPERRRIYDECGFKGLKQSESCYAESVFEKDAFQLYEDFFNGSDPEARDFLLMNGGESSDSEGSEEMDFVSEPAAVERVERVEPPLPPEIAKAVGVEKTAPGLDEQFRALLNSALLAAPQPASGGAGAEESAQAAQAPKLSWKYWKGLHRLRRNCPKSGN